MSGSAAFDDEGQLVGMVVAKLNEGGSDRGQH